MLHSKDFEEFLNEFENHKKCKWTHSDCGPLELIDANDEEIRFRATTGIWVYVHWMSYPGLKRKLSYEK